MFASSSKHILNSSLRRTQACSDNQRFLVDLRRFLASRDTGVRCAHQQARPNSKWSRKPQGRPRTKPVTFGSQPSAPDAGLQSQFNRLTPLSKFNSRILDCCSRGRIAMALSICAEMKQEGVKPDLMTYKHIMRGLSAEKLPTETFAVFKDMQAAGFAPDQESYNIILTSMRGENSEKYIDLFCQMKKRGLINAATYDAAIGFYVEGENVDMALQKLAEMNDLGMNPSLTTAQNLVLSVAEQGLPRLAMDLAIAFEGSSLRRIDTETWVKLLVEFSDNLYAEGVQYCWDKLTNKLQISLHEGICISVLNTAARHGLPALAASVLHELEAIKVPLREYHFAPVLEAFVVNGQIKEAFRILDLIRSSGSEPTIETALPILRAIQTDPDAVDNAYSILEELVSEGQRIEILALNTVLSGAVHMSDIQRAIGIYKSLNSLNLKPNLQTFNLLLDVCRRCSHFELSERLVKDMAEAGIKLDTTSYRNLIGVYLAQTNYEEAFFYLEHMKGQGLKPTYYIYESIIRRCISTGDTRYKLAVEELEQMGYKMQPGLKSLIESGGETSPKRKYQ